MEDAQKESHNIKSFIFLSIAIQEELEQMQRWRRL
jgi:hypothetical protein